METQQSQKLGFFESNKALFKGLVIGVLILLLIIPVAYISNLVEERKERQNEVVNEVSSKWSDPQTLTGPVLMIPYWERTTQKDGRITQVKNTAYFLPDNLNIDGKITTENRGRTLYQVNLLKSKIQMNGTFQPLKLQNLNITSDNLLWPEARLVLGLSDVRGLTSDAVLNWNNEKKTLETGLPDNPMFKSGISIPVNVSADKTFNFSADLNLKSASHYFFSGLGNTSTVKLSSDWTSPSFDGKFLPDSSIISPHGFTATWKTIAASRPYPQQWKNSDTNINAAALGVRFVDPNNAYVKTERVVKYAVLFIGLTFAVFFLIEMLQKIQIHPLQYALVGIALCVFYTLLLSISEYAGFDTAYIIASAATIILIGLYLWSVFNKLKTALVFTFGLSALYAYIYFLIQLEEMSLIFGSVALFLVIAFIMYFTRKVDWYATSRPSVSTT